MIVLRVLAGAACAALAACTHLAERETIPDRVTLEREYRVERVAKPATGYTVYRSGYVQLPGRGIVRLLAERADDLLLLLPIAPDTPVPPPSAPGHVLDTIEPPPGTPLALRDIGSGLPRTGQWRERFTLAHLDAGAAPAIVSAPARKGAPLPNIFVHGATGWSQASAAFPSRHYDYGSATSGDFDGDGDTDLAFAMHMQGFAALFADAGAWHDRSQGLPSLAQSPRGSGRTLLARPMPGGDHLLALREPMLAGPGIGLQSLRWRDGAWQPAGLSVERVAGDRMSRSRTGRCGTWLAVADTQHAAPRLWQVDGDTWHERQLDGFPMLRARIADVMFGDVDGDGCDDLAVAYSPQSGGTWHGSVDVFLARRDGGWQRRPMRQARSGARPTALGLLPIHGEARSRLAVLDDAGDLRLFSLHHERVSLDHLEPAPAWRRGCAGSAVTAADLDGDGHAELVASFAGEPSSLDPSRCRNGGALQAWSLR